MHYEYWIYIDVLRDDRTVWKTFTAGRSTREGIMSLAEESVVNFRQIGMRAEVRAKRSTDLIGTWHT